MKPARFLLPLLLIVNVSADDPKPAYSELHFIHSLQENNAFKIEICQAALAGNASEGIREWAALEQASCAERSRDLDAIAASKGFAQSPPLDGIQQKRLDELKASGSAAFDKMFMTDFYLAALGDKAACTLEEKFSSNQDLKNLASKTKALATAEAETLSKIKIRKN